MRRPTGYGYAGAVSAAFAALLLVPACGVAPGTKAGGGPAPVTLRMADAYAALRYEPAVADFVTRLEKSSGGQLRVRVAHRWGNFAPDAEQQVVRAVAAGRVDLAWVGTRALDTLGVRDFRALDAPLLIDSYALEREVVASDVPGRMLKGLDRLQVTGLAVLAGGLRKPIAVEGPLLGPAQWRGARVQTFASEVQADTIRALGATPVQVGPLDRDKGLKAGTIDGFENSLHIYAINSMEPLAPYMTLNVSLWPETAVLIANPRRLAALDGTDADRIRAAAARTAARSTGLVDLDDDALVAERCRSGAHFAQASAAQLRALRAAVEPVYRRLEQDLDTRAYLADIRALKSRTTPEPPLTVPVSCARTDSRPGTADGATTSPKQLDGTYRWTLTKDDARTHGPQGEDLAFYPSTFTMTLSGGTWTMKQTASPESGTGTYTVAADHITFLWPDHPSVALTASADARGDLIMSPVEPMDAGDRFVWSTRVWTKVG